MAPHRSPTGVTLHRFFLPPEVLTERQIEFPRDVAHQINRVLRLVAGDRVIVLDGSGWEWVVRLGAVGKTVVGEAEVRRANAAEPDTQVTLYCGLLKSAKFELVLQKCTEIGVSAFIPITTERSVPSKISAERAARFAAICREAAEQSGRGRIPQVLPTRPLGDALPQAALAGPALFLWEEERCTTIGALSLPADAGVSLFVGPEGGFSQAEVALAKSLGAHLVTLGPRILRAETAAIAGAAILLSRLG